MGTGISVVFNVNKRGGFRKTTGDQWLMDLLAVALLDGYSYNPFQQVGISEGIIFENPDDEMWNDLKGQIEDIFERFEDSGLAKLSSRADNLQQYRTSEGQYGMKIFFINLEKNAPVTGTVIAGSNGFYGGIV